MDKNKSILKHNVVEIIDEKSLIKRLASGKKLRVKFGADPTSPDLHLGHIIALDKLRQFQEAGHIIIFLIGDYTARVGDPSGKSKTRPILSEEDIEKNAKTYFDQVGKILDIKKIEIRRNSEWYQKMTLAEVIKIASKFSLSRIVERDDFEKRIKTGSDVRYHEGLYPIMQAYDSVMLKADIEIGGTDQKFNLLAGRIIQRRMDQKPQDIITLPLLIGIDGKKKMSKSLGNYIGVSEDPNEMYGKVMSIRDEMVIDYFKLVTNLEDFEIEEFERDLKLDENPKEIKERLAIEIVTRFHGKKAAEKARERFNLIFAKKLVPEEMPEVEWKLGTCNDLPQLLVDLKFVKSKSEAKRLVAGGGVKIDKTKIEDIEAPICIHDGMVIQVGKRKFLRIKAKK
ncbi:MAG: tyrosine--tRNA ligase [Candidatus Berkelbacteria bacterium]|nr:tyrosine--tRNA ligase [Candidatus Berkelbacteria bacterium]